MDSSTANDVNIPVEDSRSCTNFKVAKISHTWTIRNFSFCEQKVGEVLQSVTFPLRVGEEHDTTEWCLRLYPKGHTEKSKEYLSLYIKLLATKKSELKARFTMGIVDAKGARLTVQSSGPVNTFVINTSTGFDKFVKQNDDLLNKTSGIMQDDSLVLFCEIQVLTDISETLENLNVIKYAEPKSHLLAKIGQLFETKKFSDVTITVRETKFQAHKNILAAQSPVFSAMFEHDTEETKQSCINMIDIDDEVVKEMLLYLYTGTVNNINENTVGLLAAANKYALQELKIMCEEALRVGLTVENAADTLKLADLHDADQLKSRAMSFICSHAADVVTTAGFQAMILSHPSLFAEVFCRVAQKKNGDSHNASETHASAFKSNASATNTC